MLERLRIRNFRGFDDLEIDNLSRINLVAGANNAGKTTLLEAIFLLGAGGNPRLALNRRLVRMKPGVAAATSIWETLWTPLFFGSSAESVGRIEVLLKEVWVG